MKFKITKLNLETIMRSFPKNAEGYQEIELEPCDLTATQAMYEGEIRSRAYHQGYHTGFLEGFHQGKKPEIRKYCGCGCGGNNCFLRYCDKDCSFYNR